MRHILFISSLLIIVYFFGFSAESVSASGTVPADYYLIAIGTTAGSTIGNVDDTASGVIACTLRDAAGIVTAGTVAGSVNGCNITAIGAPIALNPVYVINYPANLVYTIDMVTPRDEISIAFNPVHIIGTDPTTDIIQGDNTLAINTGSRMFNFFRSDSTLCNLTLRYGDGRGREGGTFINQVGELTLENVRVYGTNSTGAGAGLANTTFGTMNITAGSIIGDQAEPNAIVGTVGAFGGAGILNRSGTMLIEDSTVHYNFTDQPRSGGGIYNIGAMIIRNSIIANNTLTDFIADGGGIYNRGELIVDGGEIHSNTTINNGGGIYNGFSAELTVSGGAIIGGVGNGNSADEGGGIYNVAFGAFGGFVRILDAEISYNTTGRGGGGIYNVGGQVDIGDATNAAIISNNVAGSIFGGGIHHQGGILNITNTVINDNVATVGFGSGGGIYNFGSTSASIVNITDSTLNSNDARFGGAIYNSGSAAVVTLNATSVTNNTSIGGGGGILSTFAARLIIENGSIIGGGGNGNTAGFSGGGIFNVGSTASISNSEVSYNTSTDGNGGGIYNAVNINPDPDVPSTMTISDSIISNNQAINGGLFDPDGGGIYNWESTLTISNTTIDDNTAADDAGGLLNEDGTVTINGGTISGNSAGGDGGGIYNVTRFGFGTQTTSTALSGVTMHNNTAGGNGGAIYNEVIIFGKSAVVTMINSRIGDVGNPNIATLGGGIYNSSVSDASAARVTVTQSYIVNNSDGFYHNNATTRVNLSCIEMNGAGFINNTTAAIQDTRANWWGALDGPSDLGGSTATGTGDGVTAGADFSVFNTAGCMVPFPTPIPPTESIFVDTGGGVDIFDPAISKIGFLQTGQVGVQGEQIEWMITVFNPSGVAGTNLTVTDTLPVELRVDAVNTPSGITSTVNGQTVIVTIPLLNPGESVQYSILTTVVSGGVEVSNTACVIASNAGAERCATASAITQLPRTGEVPWWSRFVLFGLGGLLIGGVAYFGITIRRTEVA